MTIIFGLATALVISSAWLRTGLAEPSKNSTVRNFEDLFSVAITSSSEWIVGSKGLVLRSFKGESWQRLTLEQNQQQSLDLLSVRFLSDGSTGWIGGENGLIYYTEDGGRHWLRRPSPQSDQNIFRVSPINSRSACAVGTEGTLLCTLDAGLHWTSDRFDHYIDLNDITFIGNNGWAVGAYRTILCTNDSGQHWRLQRGGNRMTLDEESYFAVAFRDAQHGWVAGLAGEIVTTNDGGASWQQAAGPPRPSLFAASGAWPNLWFGGKRGALFEHFGGDNWRDAQLSFADITDISFEGERGVAVGLGGTILRTSDGGKTWHSVGAN